jgi:tight adherence protein C
MRPREPLPYAWLIALMLGALGFYAPNLWLSSRVEQRQLLISRALPDTLDLLVTCVEAGLGVEASLARVTQEIHLSAPLLAVELQHTLVEINAGRPRTEAFRRLAERTGLDDLRSLSATFIQTEMFGTSVAQALRIYSASMRIRRTHRAEEKAATVAVKMMVPMILFILPSLLCVILGPAVVRMVHALLPALSK